MNSFNFKKELFDNVQPKAFKEVLSKLAVPVELPDGEIYYRVNVVAFTREDFEYLEELVERCEVEIFAMGEEVLRSGRVIRAVLFDFEPVDANCNTLDHVVPMVILRGYAYMKFSKLTVMVGKEFEIFAELGFRFFKNRWWVLNSKRKMIEFFAKINAFETAHYIDELLRSSYRKKKAFAQVNCDVHNARLVSKRIERERKALARLKKLPVWNKLDSTDKMIAELVEDSFMSLREIANRVGLSKSTVERRLKRMLTLVEEE